MIDRYLAPVFRSRLLWRIYTGYVVVILVCTLVVGALASRQVTANGLQEINQSLAVRASMLAELAEDALVSLNPDLQQTIARLGKRTEARLTVIAADGRVVADSEELPQNMDNHGQRPEIQEARVHGVASTSRYSDTLQQQMVYRAVTVVRDGQLTGFVRVSLPLTAVDQKLAELRWHALIGALLAALAALIFGFFIARRLAEPLRNMTEIAEAISEGDFNRRIETTSRDEIGQLARAFNRMARSSAVRMSEITANHDRLSKILTGMVEGVVGVDPEEKIIHINHAARTLLALSTIDCVGRPFWEIVRNQEINAALAEALKTRGVTKTLMRQPTEAHDRVVEIYAAALQDDAGDSVGAVIVLHDISDLAHLERVRRDFVANASHELKTPITAIRGMTETILEDPQMDSETQRGFIERVHTQSLRLSQLVLDLLTISRLDNQQMNDQGQRFDLATIVRQSAVAVQEVCTMRQLLLELNLPAEPVLIPGDSQAMAQLVDNLLDNAAKYTQPHGKISATIDQQADSIRLVIADTGIGISPKYQSRIFERFYRVDAARSKELGGTGLGLSIVKHIAELHGGTVSVQSQLSVGTTFTVTLPA